jgi:3-phosphoglycerate kinase
MSTLHEVDIVVRDAAGTEAREHLEMTGTRELTPAEAGKVIKNALRHGPAGDATFKDVASEK